LEINKIEGYVMIKRVFKLSAVISILLLTQTLHNQLQAAYPLSCLCKDGSLQKTSVPTDSDWDRVSGCHRICTKHSGVAKYG
jgi:hypothetical protein